ncbi:MAG: TolC family protein, partial [Flavobacteriales bacterium]
MAASFHPCYLPVKAYIIHWFTCCCPQEIRAYFCSVQKIRICGSWRHIVLLFAISYCGLVSAQRDVWSLQQCIDYGLQNNLRIRKSVLGTELARWDLVRARADVLPTLNGFASHSYNFGRTLDPLSNEFATDRVRSNSFSINSSVTLFEGFRKVNTIRQAQLNYKAGQYDADEVRNNTTLGIASAYLQILFDRELLQIAKDQLDIGKQQRKRTQQLVDAGRLAMGD